MRCAYFSNTEILAEMQNFTRKLSTILTCPLPVIKKNISMRGQCNTGTVFPERLSNLCPWR